MKNILPLFVLTLFLASCGSSDKQSVDAVIESQNIESIRAKKAELVSEQNLIKEDIKKLDIVIATIDDGKKIPLITTFKLESTIFKHFLELQGNVTTKDLLMIYPEYSGVLTNVYVKEGQKVSKGQILAKIDDGGLSQQLAQLKIQAELAKTTFERQQRLWDQKIGSEMQYLQAKSNYEAQGQAIAQLEQQVAKTIVRAPFSGTIDDVFTEQGSVVMPGQSELMRIVSLDHMYIVTDVPEKYIAHIKRDKKVEVEFPILGKKIDSKVRQVGDFINPNNRTFKVEISIPNKDNSIKPNLTAKLKINDYSNETALLIPQGIISENASGEQYIYVIKEKIGNDEAKAEKTVIETGLTQGDFIEVTKGLQAGDDIIMEGARSVNDGQKVKKITLDPQIMVKQKKVLDKEFGLSSWAINNKTTIYVVILIILFSGLSSYNSMPRESFPEVKETKIYVSSIYPGNTAEDVEKLLTDPIEEKLKTVSNVVEITSTSQEDYSMVVVEFDENISVDDAKQKVKDEIDSETAGEDWPTFNGAKVEPNVFELTLSEEMPILNINISGDYQVEQLKKYGEYLEDEIESLSEIKQVDIRGAQEKEVEIAVDIYKMMAAKVSFDDLINAVNNGNITMSAGNLVSSGQRRTIRIIGEIERPSDLDNFVVKSENNSPIYLKDVADVSFKEKERTTYAREFGHVVVMLDVKKRSGKNMVDAAEKIQTIVEDAKINVFPSDLKITITNDQSPKTIGQVDDLVNNIVFGIILVVTVLMFFLGFRNALFVGFAIPMSMLMSLMILDALGYSMNTMVLFGLIMGLGMLVDNGIVVVENVYRLMDEEGMSRKEAAKKGISEIAFPIIISTATTIAAFIPLGLWPGIMGDFMIYLPITLSVVLGSSLFVAIFFNSVMVSQFMSTEDKDMSPKNIFTITGILALFGILIMVIGGEYKIFGSLMLTTAIMLWVYRLVLRKMAKYFQSNILTKWEIWYEKTLKSSLSGWKPFGIAIGTMILLLLAFAGFGASVATQRTKVEFFPDNVPNQIIVYIEYPQGTDIEKTNKITKEIEARVYLFLNAEEYSDNDYNFMVESTVSQVGEGAGNPQTDAGSAAEMPHKSKITASMREFKFRKGMDSEKLRQQIQEALVGIYPGVAISVEKDANGPSAGYPINVEIEGDDYAELIHTAEKMKDFINRQSIQGIDELKIDVNRSKPSMYVTIDRRKAGELGVSAGQVGQQLRNSIFGSKAGVYKEGGEDYDIYVRFNERDKYNKSAIFNQKITFRDPATGKIKEVPVSAVTSQKNNSGFSAIKHKDAKRVVTLYSALSPGFTDAGVIVNRIQSEMEGFSDLPAGVKIDYTGQIEEQNKQMAFLVGAFFSGLGLIFLILIFQFNSVSKPAIIMLAIFLSLIGVFGGLIITGNSFVIMMTMVGIISLAGIVVNNGVVLLDYTQLLIDRKKAELELDEDAYLDNENLLNSIIKAGKARLRPVLLTAITTILGLIPLAIGFNINFYTLFTEFDPQIYIGGDNVVFWGPLAKTVIYGLLVATFLTLVVVPILFYLITRFKMWLRTKTSATG